MGYRGPAPQPTALKRAMGNPGRRPLNTEEPKPRPDAPKCPAWLNETAKSAWRQLVPELKAMGVLTHIDGYALANYCQTWARWRRAEEFIEKHGDVVPIKDAKGRVTNLQQVPQVAIARTLLQVLNRYQREFGLTPAARTQGAATPFGAAALARNPEFPDGYSVCAEANSDFPTTDRSRAEP